MMPTVWLEGTSNPIRYYPNRDIALVDGKAVTAMEMAQNPALANWISKQEYATAGPVLDQWGNNA